MGKKKIFNKHLEKGKFYSINKHPGLIVFKRDRANIYIAIITGTSRHRHQIKLSHPTEPRVKESYVNNRPLRVRRRRYRSGRWELRRCRIRTEASARIPVR